MAVLDIEILTNIQYHVVEPDPDGGVTWVLGDWTASTVINYMNQRQDRFLQETGIVTTLYDFVAAPNISRYDLPQTTLSIDRVSWEDVDGITRELPRSDEWELDHGYPNWAFETSAVPTLYTEYTVPQRMIQVAPTSFNTGTIHLLFVAAGETLSNSGVEFTVPDFCVPSIMWGVLADMLGESARVQDAQRAAYCEQRYQLGVETALILLNSWGQK